MAKFIKELYDELLAIRTYLIKIGPSRRHGNILNTKLSEAKVIVEQYNNYLHNISRVERLNANEQTLINTYCENFSKLYKEICELCQQSEVLDNLPNMEKFDLKVALSLLPVMTDEVSVTRQLIDGIEYYSSVIDDESKKKLANFVIKSRLSQGAKLKLNDQYDRVSDLLTDMKRILLPQKSASSLQKQLLNFRQNDMSIDDFGKKLSEMFVDLTISQSDGNTEKYNILKAINEKQAIRQFSDGLRNHRISTIISAQRFGSLKDAIQAAVDEEVASSNTSPGIMSMRYNNNNFRTGQQYSNRGFGGGGRGRQRGRGRGSGRGSQPFKGARQWGQQPQSQPSGYQHPTHRGGRGYYRGNSFNNNYRGNRQYRGHIRTVTNESQASQAAQPQPSTSAQRVQHHESENEFFRV